ncbi:MAG: hypothetical protein IBX69_10540 [Anaerolineales bacterium]|nr:hypothetical protein [Anaerolineales bacterium]
MEVIRAVDFIEANGSHLEKARIRHILFGVQPESETIWTSSAAALTTASIH